MQDSRSALPARVVGRDRELRFLRDVIQRAATGIPQVVLVSGEAGIGKTALVRAAVEDVAEAGSGVIWSRASEQGGAPVYWLWIQILRRLQRVRAHGRDDDVIEGVLERMSGAAATAATASDPEAARFALFDQVVQVLSEAAATEPLVLVLEDLHAGDLGSLRLLRFIVDHVLSDPVCVIATFREEEASQAEDILPILAGISAAGSRLRLTGLGPDDAAAILSAASSIEVSSELAHDLYSKTRGNPFFVLQMASVLANRPAHAPGLPLPEEVRVLVRSRIALLPEDTRNILTTGAVLGRDVDLEVLHEVTGEDEDHLRFRLNAALEAGLIEPNPSGFSFVHALVVEAIVEDQSIERRRALHLSVAEALTRARRDTRPPVAEIAHHYLEAVPFPEIEVVLRWGRRAAEQATAALAFEEAVALYERMLAIVRDDRERCALSLGLAGAVLRAGDGARSIRLYQQAAGLARHLADGDLLAAATLGIVGGPETFTIYERDTHLLRSALELVASPSPSRAMLLARLSTSFVLPEHEKRPLSDEALQIAIDLDDVETLAYVLRARQALLLDPHHVEERLRIADELLTVSRRASREDLVAVAHTWRCIGLFQRGDFVEGEAALDAAEAAADRLRDPILQTIALSNRAMLAARRGLFDEAESKARAAYQVLARAHVSWRDFPLLMNLLPIAFERSDLTEVRALVDRLIPVNPGNLLLQAVRALIRIEEGESDTARQLLDHLTSERLDFVTPDMRSGAALFCSRLAWTLSHQRAAEVCYRYLASSSGFAAFLGGTSVFLGQFDLFLGRLAASLGDHRRAEDHLIAALQNDQRIGAPVGAVQDQIALAEVYCSVDKNQDAAELLEDALETARTIGLPRSVREIEHLASRLAPTPVEGDTRQQDLDAAPTSVAAESDGHKGRLTREGEFWTVRFEDEEARLRDSKGLAYLARLLAHPGRELHVLDIVGGFRRGSSASPEELHADAGSGLELLDEQAKRAYRARLDDLREEIDEAASTGDGERAARATAELQAITDHLTAAMGLGGRTRKVGSAAERARLSVSRAVKTARARIASACPRLGAHLEATIHTGYLCSYKPDPRVPVSWEL